MNKCSFIIFLSLLSTLLLCGCDEINGDFEQTRSTLATMLDAKITKEHQVVVGLPMLFFVRSLAPVDDKDVKIAKNLLKSIRKIQVGVFNVSYVYTESSRQDLLDRVDKVMENDEWEVIVRHVDKEELVGIYVHLDVEKELDSMLILSLENEELTMVHINGRLERLVELAIRDNGFNIDG